MYFKRASPHCELMRTTFSVMLSMVRSLRTGTDVPPGTADDMLDLLRLVLLLVLLLLQRLALSRPFFRPELPRRSRVYVGPEVVVAGAPSLDEPFEQFDQELQDAVHPI